MKRLLASSLAAALAPWCAANAADAPTTKPTAEAARSQGDIATAQALIEAGELFTAKSLLETRLSSHPHDVETLFLLGMVGLAQRDYRTAITRFRQALTEAPDATRIRLELARAFYEAKDYENAFRQFQRARAGNPPPPVIAAIDRYLLAIRAEKSWSYALSVSAAPDTNINNGTSAQQVDVFGTPFDLDDTARRHSGVGLAVDGAFEADPRIGGPVRFRLGTDVQWRDYSGSQFDDLTVAALAGPKIVLPRWDVGLAATGFRRWFGNRLLDEGYGVLAETTRYLDGRTAVALRASAQNIDYPSYPLQSGPTYSASVGLSRALNPTSGVSVDVGGARQLAQTGDLSSWTGFVQARYSRDLPAGYSISVEPAYSRSTFDLPDFFSGVRREDALYQLRLTILNRRILIFDRFTPRFAYSYARRDSTIALYRFEQHRYEVGMTSVF